MARITFSLTPVRLSSMSRSVDRSKRAGREAIIVMMDFSLKPALTSFTTAAFVSGAVLPVCAQTKVEPKRRQRTRRRLRLNKKPFIIVSSLLRTTRRFSNWLRIIPNNVVLVAAANALDVIARLFKRGDSVTVIEHPAFARIITRQRQIHSPVEHGQQFLQILRAATDVFSGIEGPGHPETPCRAGHQLH